MNIRTALAITACRASRALLRRLGKGGTNLPGEIALKICPDILKRLSEGVSVIIITGTNGKTTTARMVEQMLIDSGVSYFANKSGANLMAGITAEFAIHSSARSGKCKCDVALIESDEAALKYVCGFVDAKVIAVTNVFRDQLDRYGEVTHTVENIRLGMEKCPDAIVCLNADDPLSGGLGRTRSGRVSYYGVDVPVYRETFRETSDAAYCRICGGKLSYDYVTYAHLGGFRCPSCGAARPEPELRVTELSVSDGDHSLVTVTADGISHEISINLPGAYNIYNAVCALSVGRAFGLDHEVIATSLSSFEGGFGRLEDFKLGDTPARMILVKNPAGCDQAIHFLAESPVPLVMAFCLNDKAQDGKDISWIWDAGFENLKGLGDKLVRVYASGIRAEDMALRLYYAGIDPEKIVTEKDKNKLIDLLTEEKEKVIIVPTYTAMLSVRGLIAERFGYKEYWEL